MKSNVVIACRVSPEILKRLQTRADLEGVSTNRFLRCMIEDFLDDRFEKELPQIAVSSMQRLEKRLQVLSANVESLGELLCFYIFHWFCYTPSVSDTQKKLQLVEGKLRYENFLSLLKRRLQEGKSLAALIFEDCEPDSPLEGGASAGTTKLYGQHNH